MKKLTGNGEGGIRLRQGFRRRQGYGGQVGGQAGNGEGVMGKMEEIAKRYHYFQAVRDCGFDFKGFRREVEALVNAPAGQ